jgi:hypothetical protein
MNRVEMSAVEEKSKADRLKETIHLLKQRPDKIHWGQFSQNPAIFEYSYESMTQPFTEELMAYRFHPRYIQLFDLLGFDS